MESLQSFIAAILLEAEKTGSKGLPVTFLMKFLYLLDVFYAEERDGVQVTDLDWYFHHFGPYSEQLQHSLEGFIKSGFLHQQSVEGRDFVLLQLGPKAKKATFDELDFSFYVKNSMRKVIRKYRYDLKGLLNYVYFRTKPMDDVVPQEKLSFSNCQKVDFQDDIKPIPLNKLNDKKQKRLRELFAVMKEKHLEEINKPFLENAPVFDEAFLNVYGNNLDDIQIDEVILAKLSFEKHDG